MMNGIRTLPWMLAVSAVLGFARCSCGPDFGGMVVPDSGVVNAYDCLCTCGIPSVPARNESQIVTACLPAPIPVDMITMATLTADCNTRVCGNAAQALAQLVRGRQGLGNECIVCTGTVPVVRGYFAPTCSSCTAISCAADAGNVCPTINLRDAGVGTVVAPDGSKCCTQVTGSDPCDPTPGPVRPSAVVCMAPSADPDVYMQTGLFAVASGLLSEGTLDAGASSLSIYPDGAPEKRVTIPLDGRFELAGRLGAGRMGLSVKAAFRSSQTLRLNVPVKVGAVTVGVPTDITLSEGSLIGTTTPDAFELGTSGTATIPGDAFNVFARATFDVDVQLPVSVAGEGRHDDMVVLFNGARLLLQFDADSREVALTGSLALAEDPARSIPRVTADFVVRGLLTNRPPVASIAGGGVVECDSPVGTHAVLRSTSTDPDGNVNSVTWHSGASAFGPNLGNGETLPTLVPLGSSTTVSVVVSDSRGQLDIASTSLTSVDTSPPTISGSLYLGPRCLRPPNHKWIVLRLDRELRALLTDRCDSNPMLRITGVRSDQPENSTGDGNTAPDTFRAPDRVCLRAERRGEENDGRHYFISVLARDRAGNEADPTIEIVVDHDQRTKCSDVALETADDGDGVCDAMPAADTAVPEAAEPGTPASSSAPRGLRGCSATGELAACWLSVFLMLRRRARALLPAFLALMACRGPSASSDSQVATCLADLWVFPVRTACTCVGSASPPECAATDCDNRSFVYFDAAELSEGYLTVSREQSTFSIVARPVSNAAHVQAGELVFDSGKPSRRIVCGDASLTFGSEEFTRADSRLSRSFRAQWSQSTSHEWRGAALEPN